MFLVGYAGADPFIRVAALDIEDPMTLPLAARWAIPQLRDALHVSKNAEEERTAQPFRTHPAFRKLAVGIGSRRESH